MACPGAVALRPEVDADPGACVEEGEPCADGAGVEAVVPPRVGEAGATGETGDGSAGGASSGAGDGGFGLDGSGDRVTAGCWPLECTWGANASGRSGAMMFGPPRKALPTRAT